MQRRSKRHPAEVIQIEGEEEEDSESQNQQEEEESDESNTDDNEDDSSIESVEKMVAGITFRNRRGQRINYLLEKNNAEQEEDEFWNDNKYFGKQEQMEQEDNEDYAPLSDGSDQFDSDFDHQTSSNDNEDNDKQNDQEERRRGRRKKYIRKYSDDLFNEENLQMGISSSKKKEKKQQRYIRKHQDEQFKGKFIHENYKQEYLLNQAKLVEQENLESLVFKIYESRNKSQSMKI